MLLLITLAAAATSATSFATDAGDWTGGTLGDGVLSLDNESATLDLGSATSVEFTARMRLVSGDAFTVSLGEGCEFTADYTGAKGLRFADSTQPFGVAELAFSAAASPGLTPSGDANGAAGVGDPEVVTFNGAWWMFYTATALDGSTGVHAATSPDLSSWTAVTGLSLQGGAEPAAAVVDGELVLYYAAGGTLYRTSTADGADFSFPTVALAPGPDFDQPGLGDPSVTVDGDGTWHLWYGVPTTGATGAATSADGLTFTRIGELSPDNSRLAALDVSDDIFGLEGAYTMLDSVGFARGADDATFADSTSDLRPILAMNESAWSEGGFGSASVVRNGNTLAVYVDAIHDGVRVIGQVITAPEPGDWGSLALTWDGTNATASWHDGPSLTCALSELGPFVVTASGTVELDETRADYAGDAVDTADTAGNAPDDSASPHSADSATSDSADTGFIGFNAGEWLGEPGGCGCASTPPPRSASVLVAFASFFLLRARSTRSARSA